MKCWSPNNKGAFIIYDWGWAKKGVGHEVVLTDKVEAAKNIGSEGGVQLFYYSGENLTCTDYCHRREQARQQI